MSKKILIVGGVAGGASCAARLRRLNEKDQIIMFEKGPHVSFSNCCLPYHLSGVVCECNSLVMMSPSKFLKSYNIEARVNREVIKINRDKQTVTVKRVDDGSTYEESYDKLVLSPGAKPIMPPFPGTEKMPLFAVRNVVDIDRLNSHIIENKAKKISVIGGGFIGVEVAENLKEAGYDVTLIEAMPQIMRPFDYDMVQILHKVLYDHGIELILSDKVTGFDYNKIILESEREVEADLVVMAIGVTPETSLAKDANLKIGVTGAIKVDSNYRTIDENIYAIGDAIEVYHSLLHMPTKLPLAGPAQKQARAVADHINGRTINNKGFIGSSVIKVFEYQGASTGLSEGLIKATGMKIDYDFVKFIPSDRVSLMPDCNMVHIKVLYEKPTRRILGAQAIGRGVVDKRIDVIATAIKFGACLEDLEDLELCYAPSFSKAKDIVNFAGYIGSNLADDLYKKVDVQDVMKLVKDDEYILDVREKMEYDQSHIINAHHIPLSSIRDRLDEIPKDRPIYVHCKTGQRSYNAVRMLMQEGFKEVYNIMGGIMGLSYYLYFNEKVNNEESILTDYLL